VRRFWFRHPERGLAGLARLAWVLVLSQSDAHVHGAISWLRLQTAWLLMVAAMMIPPALPMARHVIQNSKSYRRQRAGMLFAGASLLLWAGIGFVAVSLAAWAGAYDYRRWLLGGSLLLAAAWELTPAKRRALKACHRTLPLPPDGRKADLACVKMGFGYSRACFRASWALMLPMALTGHGVAVMMLATGIAVAEEVVRKGYRLAPVAAVLLTVAGMMVLVLG
jgi:predicted metal-binding membrane protein